MATMTHSRSELIARTRWYIYLRWGLICLVVIPSLITSYIDVGWGSRFIRDFIFCCFAFATNGVYHILIHRLKRASSIRVLAYVLAITDVAIITFFLYSKGGIESRSVILYMLPLLASAAVIGRRGTYLTAFLSIVGYTFIILGAFLGWFGAPLSMYTPQLDSDGGYVANTIVFFDLVIAIVAVGLDYMTHLLIINESKARQALQQLRQAQLIAKIGGWEYDMVRDEIRFSDELFSVMNAFLPTRTMSRNEFANLIHEGDRALVKRKLRIATKSPTQFTFDFRLLTPDGLVHYVHIDSQSFADRHGKVVQVLGSARDITEERSLQKARNDFVALASHQLRTPATIVKQYIGMLKEGYVGSVSPEQQDMLQIAYETNERQIKIVNDLLNVARIDSNSYKINRTPTDIAALLQNIVRDQATKFLTKQQKLALKLSDPELILPIDGDGIRMVIDNILDNAHKYTPKNKRVDISLLKKANSAIISIADNGIGIDKNDLPKIFKLFSRVENSEILQQEGTGLGLYWAERIVSLHKGKITVESHVGKGTTFTITLPLI